MEVLIWFGAGLAVSYAPQARLTAGSIARVLALSLALYFFGPAAQALADNCSDSPADCWDTAAAAAAAAAAAGAVAGAIGGGLLAGPPRPPLERSALPSVGGPVKEISRVGCPLQVLLALGRFLFVGIRAVFIWVVDGLRSGAEGVRSFFRNLR